MYKIFFIALFISLLSINSFGQSGFLSLDYRFGQPLNLKPQTPGIHEGYEYQNAENLFEQALVVNYAPPLWKKHLLYANVGFNLSRTRRYQNFVEFNNQRHIDNIVLNDNRFDFHLGLEKKFALFDDKLMINAGWRLAFRTPFKKSIHYSLDDGLFDYNNGNTIAYNYDLTTHHGTFYKNPAGINQSGKIGHEFFAGFNLRMTEKLYFNFNVNLTTHNIFYYDYRYQMLYHSDGVKINDIEHHGFLTEHKYGVRDNFFFLSTGISFQLGKN